MESPSIVKTTKRNPKGSLFTLGRIEAENDAGGMGD
jgi:hypothetical protein